MVLRRAIPCLLLKGDALVKTIQYRKPTYVGDPLNTARIFNKMEVDELFFLDIRATVDRSPLQYGIVERVATEVFVPLAYGGGVRTIEQARQLFAIGVEKIVVNTALVETPSIVEQIVGHFGSQSVVAAIDVKRNRRGKWQPMVRSGTKKAPMGLLEFLEYVLELGVGEILLTSIDQEGTRSGFDLPLVETVNGSVSVPVVAHGGADSADDIAGLIEATGVSGVALGSMVVHRGKHRAVLVSFPEKPIIDRVLRRG